MKHLRTPAYVVLALLVSACGGGTVNPPTNAGAPEISAFTAAPETVAPGETATLTWEVSGSNVTLSLKPGDAYPVDVSDQALYETQPTATTTYALIAQNEAGSDQEEVVIKVEAAGAANQGGL